MEAAAMSRPTKYHQWTNHQVERLKLCWPTMSKARILELLAPHPWRSIEFMARQYGLRRQGETSRHDWMEICRRHAPVFRLEAAE
jgi:hypothetical protein